MKNMVLIPSTPSGIPCARHPISFPNDLDHTSLYFGHDNKCQYSNNSLVSPFMTVSTTSHNNLTGNFLLVSFFGEHSSARISTANNSASCVIVRGCVHDLVLIARLLLELTMGFSSTAKHGNLQFWFMMLLASPPSEVPAPPPLEVVCSPTSEMVSSFTTTCYHLTSLLPPQRYLTTLSMLP